MDDNGLTSISEERDTSARPGRLPIEQVWGRHLLENPSDEHLTDAALTELVAQGSRLSDYAARMDHIVCCPLCRRQFKEIRATVRADGNTPANASAVKPRHGWFSFKFSLPSLVIGGGLGAVATAVILLVLRPEPVPSVVRVASPALAANRLPTPVTTPTPAMPEVIRRVALPVRQERKEPKAIVIAQQRKPSRKRSIRPVRETPAQEPLRAIAPVRVAKPETRSPETLMPPLVIDERDLIAAATDFTDASLPSDLTDLRTKDVATLGSEPATPNLPRIQPLSAFGSYVRDGRPVLRWQTVKGATLYKVEIGDPDGADNQPSQKADRPQFQPTEALVRGRTYQWRVTAYEGTGMPSPTVDKGWGKPLARTEWLLFKVLSEDQVASIEKATEAEKTARLAAAKIYAQHGLLDDAETNLSELLKELKRPGDAEKARAVHKAAQQLQEVIHMHRRPKTENPQEGRP